MDRQIQQTNVLQQLFSVYGDIVDSEIICSVANNCQFHFGRSSTMLDEISSNAGNFATKNPFATKKFNYRHTNGTTRHVLNPKQSQLNQTTDQIKRGYKVLVILRGLPGSGKSYLARKIVEISVGSHDYHNFIFSADDYFMRRGTYQYDPTKIQEAHTFNQQRAFGAMKNGVSPVIIDNTNTQMWEIKPYAMVASKYAYIIEILEPCTPWAFNEKELSRRNTHGVPRVKLKEMLMRYERGVTPEKVFRAFGIRYENLMPPQLRLYPSLMEEKPKCFEEKQAKKVEVKKEEQKPSVDEMLSICKNDNAIILKPKVCSTTIPEADLSLWGVSESALHSWDVCTPITTKQAEKLEQVTINETATASSAIQTVEAATNTSSNDFLLAANPESDVKILITNCRDINQHSFYEIPPLPRKKIVVDKSSMVGEDLMEQRLEKKDAIQQLKTVFPSIPHIYLREIYDKCKGDLDWAIDLLCDDSLHKLVSPQENLQEEEEEEQNQADETSEKDQFVELNASALIDNTTTSTVTDDAEKEELKRILEERVVIGDDFYSEHILKLKSKNSYDPTSQPSTSKVHKISTDAGNVIAVDSDVDMDDFDLETASESTSNGSDSQEMMELNLGEAFVTELESKLQESTLQYPKGFLPIVQVPVALARQLYALYIESVYQQMDAQNEVLDMLVKEDEEFAKKLQAQEVQSQPRPEPTTIPEIMQEQHELNLCRKEVEQWKNLTPDDFAAKMTMKKLFESFPNIARDVLVEIWQAHGNSYKETVESIMASSPNDADIGANVKIDEPPVSEEIFGEMREAYNQQNTLLAEDAENKTAHSYRQDAARYLENRKMLYQKAMQAYQKGMTEVAIYYSGLAKKQTELYDQANNLAASTFLNEHSQRHKNYDTLDLHFLYVKEAIAALDMFLDNSIHLLKGTNKIQYLFIITGRGKRSANGVSKIKPAVKARLKKRKINYVEINPGLLKVKVNQNSIITTDLPETRVV